MNKVPELTRVVVFFETIKGSAFIFFTFQKKLQIFSGEQLYYGKNSH